MQKLTFFFAVLALATSQAKAVTPPPGGTAIRAAAQQHDTAYVMVFHTGPVPPEKLAAVLRSEIPRIDPNGLVLVGKSTVTVIVSVSDAGQGLDQDGCTHFTNDTGVPPSFSYCVRTYPLRGAQ